MILSRLPKTSPVPFLSVETPNIRLILNFMRDGHVDHQKYSEDVEKIQKEAQFCLLDGLDKFCISKTKLQKSTILVDSDDDIVRVIRESKKNAVLVVLYNSNPKEISEQVAEAVMLCGDKIDVCLNFYELLLYTARQPIHPQMPFPHWPPYSIIPQHQQIHANQLPHFTRAAPLASNNCGSFGGFGGFPGFGAHFGNSNIPGSASTFQASSSMEIPKRPTPKRSKFCLKYYKKVGLKFFKL
ncbi:hypothetical protein B9Z55_026068 [Caenorhabditis nigoni]|uniref:Potassium channel tetramerisation-type BTB domain-containing protein n=1 Tax=Caenorhabditis nigoni TaxID=1611254 RepID=A0A2G5T1N2_9PELO|nr:hypothetical protein B9Z55_026068 [Caenorhabditis nigoni]